MLALKQLDTMPADQDNVHIDQAVNGDVDAFERLYHRHVGRIQGLARWLLGQEDVEDVVQDVFIRVWQKLGTFRAGSRFSACRTRIRRARCR